MNCIDWPDSRMRLRHSTGPVSRSPDVNRYLASPRPALADDAESGVKAARLDRDIDFPARFKSL